MSYLTYEPKIGDKLICPVCAKEFKATDDTKYICCGGYTCSWKCFMDGYKKYEKKPTDNKQKRRARKSIVSEIKQETVNPPETKKADEFDLFGIIE